MYLLSAFLLVAICLLSVWYKRWVKRYDFWRERGVVHRKPYPLVGNLWQTVLRRKTIGEVIRDISNEYKNERYVGFYNFTQVCVIVNEPDDVKSVLVENFSNFVDRGQKTDVTPSTLDRHLFVMTGSEWKGVRSKIAPAFSSGKLKAMFPLMMKSYDNVSNYLNRLLKRSDEINSDSVIDMYTIGVSASTIYGMDPSRLADPDSQFKRTLDSLSRFTFTKFVAMTIAVFLPSVAARYKISPMGDKQNYFIDLILDTFRERTESGVVKDDIIQNLLDLKRNGQIEVSQWSKEDEEELGSQPSTLVTQTIEITDDILVAQAFLFLMAGLDPMKSAVAMLIIQLCKDKRVYDKLREDVESRIEEHNGLNWQALKHMKYLDWCLSETLRMFPAAEFTMRYCLKDITLPSGFTVEKGTRVVVPTYRLHTDPNHFPQPDVFRPERFENEPLPWVYLPFGQGPRMCLARRFALQQMKLLIARLVEDYDMRLSDKTELPVKTEKWFFLRRHVTPIYIHFNKRTCKQ